MVITGSCGTPVPHQGTEGIWFDSGVNFHYDLPLETGQRRSFPVGPIQQAVAASDGLFACT